MKNIFEKSIDFYIRFSYGVKTCGLKEIRMANRILQCQAYIMAQMRGIVKNPYSALKYSFKSFT